MTDNTALPLVSAIITSYNYEDYIGEAMESVIAQTYLNWELIVVDDASTDSSVEIINQIQQRYPDKIKVIVMEENHGVGFVSNVAYDNCRGEFIAHLGSDDRMMPQRIEKQMKVFEGNPKVGVVCTDVAMIDQNGIRSDGEGLTVFSKPITDLRNQLLEGNFLNSPSATFRKCILEEVGTLNPVLHYVQDFDHWLRILEHYDIERLDEKLTEYRVHGKNLSVQATGELAYAGHYETATVIFNAIKRRDGLLNSEILTQQQIIDEKLFLAEAAKKAEYMFLGTFKYAVQIVYGLVLDVLALDPKHQIAKEVLSTVYSAFGDEPRAVGKKSITESEFLLSQQKENESRSLYQIAIETHEQTDASLAKIVKNILKKEKAVISAQIRKEQKEIEVGAVNEVSGIERRNYFCANLVSYIVSQAEPLTDYPAGKRIPKKMRSELNEVNQILEQGQTLGKIDPVAHELKVQIRAILDNDLYQTWIRKHELREIDAEILAEQMMLKWHAHPELHCVLFLLPGEESLLADTIDSLAAQLYSKWHLTVIAETESPDPIFDQVENLHWRMLSNNELPYDVLNQVMSELGTEWTAFIEPGTRFEAHALAKIVEYINLYPEWSFIYTDDDWVNGLGERSSPQFKPDFNLDLLRSSPYIGDGWMRIKDLLPIGGIRQLPGAENYDVALRWLDSYGESVIGHIADVLIHRPKEGDRPFDTSAGMIALQQHLERNAISASVHQGYLDDSYRVEYLHTVQPKVSIIIPNKDKLEYFQPCIESVLEKTTYSNYEVIVVDNQSTDPDTIVYYDFLTEHYAEKVKVYFYDESFNFSAMNNFAAEKALGDYLLMLNNDTEIIQDDWLTRMMSYGQRNDVGIVGARLVYPTTGKVQHIGIILGLNQIADHPYNSLLNLKDEGHMGRAQLDQNYSAVTAAVLLIKKEVYQAVEGMDEKNLFILYNDVDLCLKVRGLGYKIVWTPHATVVHHGNVSMKKYVYESIYTDYDVLASKSKKLRNEQQFMRAKWLPELASDPAYNKNLTLTDRDFKVDIKCLQNWDVNIRSRLRCLGMPISGGSGYYRIKQPFNTLSQQGLVQCEIVENHLSIVEIERLKPDTYVFQNVLRDEEIDNIHLMKDCLPQVFKVYSLDDLLHDIPEKSSQYRPIKASYRDAKARLRKVLKYCDRLIVSTQPLADLCSDMIDDIQVVPNRLERDVWVDLTSKRQQGDKPRVGWAGAQQHQGDLEIIYDVVKATADKVDWIFMGMHPDELKPYIKEYHEYTSIDKYPEKLANLNLDLAIAPLEQHPFNESKSNLRILEYGILGWPVICSDIYPYQSYGAPVTRVSNETQAWIDAINQALSSTEILQESGDNLRKWVLDSFILEDHLQEWQSALTGSIE